MFAVGAVELLVFFVPLFALFVYALADALRRDAREWEAARQPKWLWVVVIVVLGFIGGLLYLLVARPQLKRATGG